MKFKKINFVTAAVIGVSLFEVNALYAHGAPSYPPSRQFLCGADSGSGVCQNTGISPNIGYDWQSMGIGSAGGYLEREDYKETPLAAHIEAMQGGMNAEICSGNGVANYEFFKDLSDPKYFHIWEENKTELDVGMNEFTFHATAPHMTGFSPAGHTGYIDIYVTKEGWDKSKAITFNDITQQPICHYVPETAGVVGNYHKYSCDIPNEYAGKDAVLFTVWQRSDSAEAFYACSNVNFKEVENYSWDTLKSVSGPAFLPKYNDLEVGDSIVFTGISNNGNSHTTIKINTQNDINDWQYNLAQKYNQLSYDTKIGVLSEDGLQVETPRQESGYRVYIKDTLDASNYSWKIERKQAEVPEIPKSKYLLPITNLSQEYIIANQRYDFKQGYTLKFRLFEDNGHNNNEIIAEFEIVDSNLAVVSQEIDRLISDQVDYDFAIGQLNSDGKNASAHDALNFVYLDSKRIANTNYNYSWVIDIIPPSEPEPEPSPEPEATYIYMHDDEYGPELFVAGVDVVSRVKDEATGLYKVYQCKDATVQGWCQQSETSTYHYEPGNGIASADAWIDTGKLAERPSVDAEYIQWPENIGSYQMGTTVSRSGVLYQCTGHQDWCNQETYDPVGIYGSSTWTAI
ncbi:MULTISPECIES: lytic polysaccharide monooxygenase [Cysteiniphilum]|uniref:lytic polysaccharide monooxygenase n=1 Tax=Cysteiniphilum TaxID=2056696 RepID=UPI00177E946B|nr:MULTISPECIES: lytic polysaccharide monooxygenase [Cysteiniphilum]